MSGGVMATELAAVFRGTTPNEAGDLVDDNGEPVAGLESFPIALTEKSRRVFDPASGQQRTIRWIVGRPTNPALDIRRDDRVKSLTTGRVYAVDAATHLARTITGGASLVLDLRHL